MATRRLGRGSHSACASSRPQWRSPPSPGPWDQLSPVSGQPQNEPKRLKKQLPKILKLLKPNDRILIVGTTCRPFDAELQSFCRVYQKIILVPRPDYASRYAKGDQTGTSIPEQSPPGGLLLTGRLGVTPLVVTDFLVQNHCFPPVLWKQIIQRNGGVITNTLNISCLAKVSDGFTQGHVVQVVRGVLTERRLRQQVRRPLAALEFVAVLSSLSPVYQEEEDSFKDWYARTPMGKRRTLALTRGNAGKAGAGKTKEKGKKDKKGKKEKKK